MIHPRSPESVTKNGAPRNSLPSRKAGVLRFATFLAPSLEPLYRFIARLVSERLECRTEFFVGSSYDEMLTDFDVGFICGLAYVELDRQAQGSIEPLMAPVPSGARYSGKPIYFSDVIVRRDSPLRSFRDLQGCSWSYNERYSQSGYGITRYHLASNGEVNGYFGRLVDSGAHEVSIRLVCSGAVDASAIDSHLLAVSMRDQPDLAAKIRVIGTLGPSTIQPVVVSRRVPEQVRACLRAAFEALHTDPAGKELLSHALVERWVPVSADSYDDIRRMRDCVEAAGIRHWVPNSLEPCSARPMAGLETRVDAEPSTRSPEVAAQHQGSPE
jgi:phosphonate transport system substrate-binding protein